MFVGTETFSSVITFFTSSDLLTIYATYIRKDRVQESVKLLVNDGRVSPFYCHYKGFYSRKIRELVPENDEFRRNICLFRRTRRYMTVVEGVVPIAYHVRISVLD